MGNDTRAIPGEDLKLDILTSLMKYPLSLISAQDLLEGHLSNLTPIDLG